MYGKTAYAAGTKKDSRVRVEAPMYMRCAHEEQTAAQNTPGVVEGVEAHDVCGEHALEQVLSVGERPARKRSNREHSNCNLNLHPSKTTGQKNNTSNKAPLLR